MLISELYTLYKQHPVITTDSRICPPGSIFFALKGESFDGNAFAEKALQSGCAYAVIDDISYCSDNNIITHFGHTSDDIYNDSSCMDKRIILVDDVLTSLQQLALMHRKTFGIPVIGVTGTNGKTTTKELTAAVLSKKYNTLFTQGNLNNHIGVPLTLLRLTHEHEIAVIEMGANHPGEIHNLANIALPDYGLITNVGYAHLEGFGSFGGVIKAKGELYDFLSETGGKIFIDKDNKYLSGIANGLEQITYGMMPDSVTSESQSGTIAGKIAPFISGKVLCRNPFLSFAWKMKDNVMRYKDTQHSVETHLFGDYNLLNALAAISIGVYFDVEPEQINEAIANYEPSNNRSQIIKTANNTIIIDTYNANPSSMKAALENFALPVEMLLERSQYTYPETLSEKHSDEQTKKLLNTHNEISPQISPTSDIKPLPKAVILGDMLELGENSQELHADIVRLAETLDIKKILLCGKQFSAAGKEHTCFSSVEALDEFLKANPLNGYHILIKGSNGIHLEKIIARFR